jgi:acyl carrier protein
MVTEDFIKNKIFEITFKNVSGTESLISTRLIDSITMIEIIVEIEEFIGKQIPQHLITDENFDSVDKILDTLKQCDV